MSDLISQLVFTKEGLIPVIVQDKETKTVLMFAWANHDAVSLTLKTGFAHYYSRSRGKLWKKGEESGHIQKISEILVDCDLDCLLYIVNQTKCACHEGYFSCFFRNFNGEIILKKLADEKEI